MLAQVASDPAGPARLACVEDRRDPPTPERLDEAGQVRVSGAPDERDVEALVGLELAIEVGAGRALGGERGFERERRLARRPLGREPRGCGLDEQPRLVVGLDVALREGRDDGAPMGAKLDQTLRREPVQRLAKRRARRAETLGERLLAQGLARRELAGEDQSPDPPVDAVGEALDLERRERAHAGQSTIATSTVIPPPSTTSVSPVTYEASSEARKRQAAAISSGAATRRSGK